jgi:hypothetical protein
MRKSALLLVTFICIISCSKDEPTNQLKCGKIISRGWNNLDGDYIKIDTYPVEPIPVKNSSSYNLGDQYCH